ncbi:ribonuclease H-like domain-containing protein [Camillea tinctor]|nr:ribonuclease H-like domain-containing protein [Camillea tinctor]
MANSTGAPYDDFGEELERAFDPSLSLLHRRVPKAQLVTYNPRKHISQLQITHPRTGAIELDRFTVVLSTDGACRGNGTASARAAWGVYFGPGSRFNAGGLLDPSLPQTSVRAEIEALAQALRIIRRHLSDDLEMQEIRIRTDSEFLVKAMSEWMAGWRASGGRNARGQPVKHYAVLKALHDQLDEMTYGDDGGRDFRFWYVPREENREADALANRALDDAFM